MATKTLKYTGGLDEVQIYGAVSGASYRCARGETVEVLEGDAEGLSSEEWQEATKKSTKTKGDA